MSQEFPPKPKELAPCFVNIIYRPAASLEGGCWGFCARSRPHHLRLSSGAVSPGPRAAKNSSTQPLPSPHHRTPDRKTLEPRCGLEVPSKELLRALVRRQRAFPAQTKLIHDRRRQLTTSQPAWTTSTSPHLFHHHRPSHTFHPPPLLS